MAQSILLSILITVVIYFGLAAILIVTGKPDKLADDEGGLAFNELYFDLSELPPLQTYKARDGAELDYRHYPAEADKVVVLLHGSGWHSEYFLPLAKHIADADLAHVYTPDLRGHGHHPERRGDIDYIGQFEDDIADLISVVRQDHPTASLIVGGHSSGGGLAVRFAGSRYGAQATGYLLLSPFLKYNAPTARRNSGGWAQPYTGRIAGLTMLNNIGIRRFNDMTAIAFNMTEEARNGTETLAYTFRLNTAYAPRNYKRDLQAVTQPLLLIAGTADEAFKAELFEPTIAPYVDAEVHLLDDVTHMGAAVDEQIRPIIDSWLKRIP